MGATAGAYERKGSIFVFSHALTTVGHRVYSGAPVTALPSTVSDSELGAAIRSAAAEYETGIEPRHPREREDVDGHMFPFLEAAGVKSWKAFVTGGARSVFIRLEADGTAEMSPSRREGQSFVGLADDEDIAADDPSDERLGAMLRECLARST